MDYSTLKNNNKYDANKIAELIVTKKIPFEDIFDFIYEDYSLQAKELREKANQILGALIVRMLDHFDKEELKQTAEYRQHNELIDQSIELTKLMLKTKEDIIGLIIEKHDKMLKQINRMEN